MQLRGNLKEKTELLAQLRMDIGLPPFSYRITHARNKNCHLPILPIGGPVSVGGIVDRKLFVNRLL